jgi:hypothetical protein
MTPRLAPPLCAILMLFIVAFLANAEEPTASDVLYLVGDQAAREALQAIDQEQPAAAQLWRQWASHYWNHADTLRATPLPADQYIARNIDFCRQAAAQAADAGQQPAARFYDTRARFWDDVLRQLQAGQKPAIRFPKREMLNPIPGLPGTPWQDLGKQRPPNGGGAPAAGNKATSDPIPRPNYQWLHGQRYTETAMSELIAWYRRQKHLSKEQQDYYIREAQKNNDQDERNERQWIQSTFGKP